MLYSIGSVIFWRGISLSTGIDLHILCEEQLTAARYIMFILEQYVIYYAPYIFPEFILRDPGLYTNTFMRFKLTGSGGSLAVRI